MPETDFFKKVQKFWEKRVLRKKNPISAHGNDKMIVIELEFWNSELKFWKPETIATQSSIKFYDPAFFEGPAGPQKKSSTLILSLFYKKGCRLAIPWAPLRCAHGMASLASLVPILVEDFWKLHEIWRILTLNSIVIGFHDDNMIELISSCRLIFLRSWTDQYSLRYERFSV